MSTLAKDYVRGCGRAMVIRIIAVAVVVPLGCVTVLIPLWLVNSLGLDNWVLIVGAAAYLLILFGGGAAYAVGGAAWLALGSLYLFVFWSLSGQTPGMRFLDIRIEHQGDAAIEPKRAARRLLGFYLAVIPFCLGFLGVLVRLDRRGFHDRMGRTAVYYVDPAAANQPHLPAVIAPMEEKASGSPFETPLQPEKAVDSPQGPPQEVSGFYVEPAIVVDSDGASRRPARCAATMPGCRSRSPYPPPRPPTTCAPRPPTA